MQMTTEAPPNDLSPSIEERMARIEAQQEIIIELLKSQDAKIDALDRKFDTKIDTVNVRIDTTNHRIFLAGWGCSLLSARVWSPTSSTCLSDA